MKESLSLPGKRRITIVLFVSVFILGVGLPLLGTTVEDLTIRFDMPISDGGLFQTMMAVGAIAAALFAGRLYDRLNARIMLPVGSAVMAAALFGLYFAPTRVAAMASALLLGLGFGNFMIGPNVLMARLNPDNPAGPIGTINFVFGVGAILSPQLVTLGAALSEVRLAYLFAASLLALVTIPLAFVNLCPPDDRDESGNRRRIDIVKLIPFLLLFYCVMGTEVSFGTWIVPQVRLAAGAVLEMATFAASMFWAGYTLSRLLFSRLARSAKPITLLVISIGVVVLGLSIMLIAPTNQTVAISSAFVIGVGIGPLFPLSMALASDAFPRSLGQVTGILSAAGNIGPLTVPWVQGRIGAGQDGGMELLLGLAVVLMGIVLFIRRRVTEA
ncbi:MAG: MFS transporter [Anaerolineae bacterium]|nr:MFS transporter [Anaerolineae bacterium]